ncbi:hypothetical protein BpHYR1_007773 [Brachionus plicatilis]|uniref:Uncharacterized protein n=1 Tax=Brachionus plicatilis TaxID=10195 RepID=A0A3M7SYN5_BRAPC|nr:hypothetical protein BpHYR1_007773 [Brachionus plicatilis]
MSLACTLQGVTTSLILKHGSALERLMKLSLARLMSSRQVGGLKTEKKNMFNLLQILVRSVTVWSSWSVRAAIVSFEAKRRFIFISYSIMFIFTVNLTSRHNAAWFLANWSSSRLMRLRMKRRRLRRTSDDIC